MSPGAMEHHGRSTYPRADADSSLAVGYPAPMGTLLDDLDAFLQEHRRCGELESGVEGARLWATCSCGAALARVLPAEDRPIAESA